MNPTFRSAPLQGQVLVETLLSALPFCALMLMLIQLWGVWTLQQALSLDLYSQARAHLYGEEQNQCAPSLLWPAWPGLDLDFECDFRGQVKGYVHFKNHLLWQDSWDLSGARTP